MRRRDKGNEEEERPQQTERRDTVLPRPKEGQRAKNPRGKPTTGPLGKVSRHFDPSAGRGGHHHGEAAACWCPR